MTSVHFSPYGLILFPLVFLLAWKWPRPSRIVNEDSRVGIIRRISALYIDMFVGMLGALPFICMSCLFVEFLVTGKWVWSFERDYFMWTDVICMIIFFAGFYGMYYYLKWHFRHGKPTLGQHLLKFRLIPVGDNPMLSVRYLVAWVNAAWWPIWPWTIFRRKQDYWWDTASRTKARMVV